MVHNRSDKELTVHQMDLLEKDAGFNTIDAKPIDFIGALEPIVHHLSISDEDKNSIRYTGHQNHAISRGKDYRRNKRHFAHISLTSFFNFLGPHWARHTI